MKRRNSYTHVDIETGSKRNPPNDPEASPKVTNSSEQKFTLADHDNPLHQLTTGAGHYLGVQPEGNLYLTSSPNLRDEGLGVMSRLTDLEIVESIFPYLDAFDLMRLACVNKAFYVLIYGLDADIWKDRVVALTGGDFVFQWFWRLTYIVEYQLRNEVSAKVATIPPSLINIYNRLSKEELKQYIIEHAGPSTTAADGVADGATNGNATGDNATDGSEANTTDNTTTTITPPLQYAKTFPPALLTLYPTPDSAKPAVTATNYFSDPLFQPWYSIDAFHANYPDWHRECNVDRVSAKDLTVEEFRERYEKPGKPVVIENYVSSQWPAFVERRWSEESLLTDRYTSLDLPLYTCGVADMTLDKYLVYAHRSAFDDAPLYLFDKRFGEKNPALLEDYDVPPYFSEDFYSYLSSHPRPSFRWWLIGNVRSGSSFHKDPLYTHAFNGLISGQKKWVLYPPHIIPPGVQASHDHLQVSAPQTVSEWFLNFYHETQVKPSRVLNKPVHAVDGQASSSASANSSSSSIVPQEGAESDHTTPHNAHNDNHVAYDHITDHPPKCKTYHHYKPVEIIQNPGDIVFIPSQWWHLAVNFKFSIAVTQNHVHESNYLDCLRFLTKIGQPSLRDDLQSSIEQQYPGLYSRMSEERKTRIDHMLNAANPVKSHSEKVSIAPTRSLLESLHQPVDSQESFGFNFGDDDDE